MRWISCKERQPEENGVDYYYLITDGEDIGMGWYDPGYSEDDEDEITPTWTDETFAINNVTHWAHLPFLPDKDD